MFPDPAKADDAQLLKKHGIEPTSAGTTTFLRTLRPDETAQKRRPNGSANWATTSFAVREAATRRLLELSIVPLVNLRGGKTHRTSKRPRGQNGFSNIRKRSPN